MANTKRGGRVFGGLIVLVVGVLFLVGNLTDWEIPWGGWWPVLVIAWGLWNLVKNRSWVGGTALVALGVFFLLDTQDVWDYTIGDIWRFWPVVLILVGAKILFARKKKSRSPSTPPQHFEDKSTPGELNITSVFGGSQQRITDQALASGSLTAVFGGAEIDLLGANLADGEASLEGYAGTRCSAAPRSAFPSNGQWTARSPTSLEGWRTNATRNLPTARKADSLSPASACSAE